MIIFGAGKKSIDCNISHNLYCPTCLAFKDFDLLAIQLQHGLLGIRQPDIGQVVRPKISGKCFGIFRTEDHNGRFPFHKFIIILTQLRHMRLAERSHKTTVKHEQHMLLPLKLRQGYLVALVICQRKTRRWCVEFNLSHLLVFSNKQSVGKQN